MSRFAGVAERGPVEQPVGGRFQNQYLDWYEAQLEATPRATASAPLRHLSDDLAGQQGLPRDDSRAPDHGDAMDDARVSASSPHHDRFSSDGTVARFATVSDDGYKTELDLLKVGTRHAQDGYKTELDMLQGGRIQKPPERDHFPSEHRHVYRRHRVGRPEPLRARPIESVAADRDMPAEYRAHLPDVGRRIAQARFTARQSRLGRNFDVGSSSPRSPFS